MDPDLASDMKFLCIGYIDPIRMARLSARQLADVMAECGALLEALYATGRVLLDIGVGERTGAVRREGAGIVRDECATALAANVGGAFLIDAEDMAEAQEIAALHPAVRLPRAEEFGWRLEVRPVRYFHLTSAMPGA